MKNWAGSVGKVCIFLCILVVPTFAQTWLQTGAPPAARGPAYTVSAGYSHISMPIPGVGNTGLNGIALSGGMDLTSRFGAIIDSNYSRTPDVLATRHIGYLLSFLGGTVLYPLQHGHTRTFVRALGGIGVVDGAVPINSKSYYYGWQSRFSYALGAGVEHSASRLFAVRIGGDYLRTGFYNSAGTVLPQNNFRMTVGLVFRLNNRDPKVAHR